MKISSIDSGAEFDFGRTSADYAAFRDIYPQSMYDKLTAFGAVTPSSSVLDLGSGTAILPIRMHDRCAHFTAADISQQQIEFGKKRAAELGITNIDFHVCPAENTGLPDGSFDTVTAVQCFSYFNADEAAKEIHRVLRRGGFFCKIFMDWLPYEDEIIAEMERLVLQYNPKWSGGGFRSFCYSYPSWAQGRFQIETIHSYNITIPFSKEAWLGRIKTCRGVGASLGSEKTAEFERDYRRLLQKYSEPLMLQHQIHMEIYRSE